MNTSDISRVRRGAKRASYDPAQIHDILDSNLICHLGVVVDGQCRVIPTAYVRIGEAIYLHGNRNNQMLRSLLDGQTACITVTELNGLVLGRSGMHHSANYRSVVVYGRGEEVIGSEKIESLDRLVDHMLPGRAAELRKHDPSELAATLVLRVGIEAASAKIRQGPPVDAEADYAGDGWAGVIHLRTVATGVEPCPRLRDEIAVPASVRGLMEML